MRQLTRAERERWREMVASVEPFQSPLLQPEYAEFLAQVRNDVEVGIVDFDSQQVGFFPFHRIGKTKAAPLGDSVSDLQAVLSVQEKPDLANWLNEFGIHQYEFDHWVARASRKHWFAWDTWYRIDLRCGESEYFKDLGLRSSLLAQTQRKQRKNEREIGEIAFSYSTEFSPEFIEQSLKWKLGDRHHFPSWAKKLIQVMSDEPTEFCRGILSTLSAGGNVISAHYGIVNRHSLVSWLPMTNPEFRKYSPGNVLMLELIKAAIQHNVQMIDLGRGENQSKQQLANSLSKMAIGAICQNPAKQLALRWKYQAKQFARRVIHARKNAKRNTK